MAIPKTHHPAIAPMFALCLKHSLPKHYVEDFMVHDMKALQDSDHSTPFLWILRECGTHIFDAPLPWNVSELFTYEPRVFAVWDGTSLKSFDSPNEAIEALTNPHPPKCPTCHKEI